LAQRGGQHLAKLVVAGSITAGAAAGVASLRRSTGLRIAVASTASSWW
jgi:hypothetical protein